MKTRRRHSAFTLVEVLLSLALTCLLLASVAAAIKSSLFSYAENEDISDAMQVARSILHNMGNEVRVGDTLASASHQLTINYIGRADLLQQVQYDYDGNSLWYRRTVNGSQASYSLIDPNDTVRIRSFDVIRELGYDPNGVSFTKSVTTRLALRVGNKDFAVTASADPRRNQSY